MRGVHIRPIEILTLVASGTVRNKRKKTAVCLLLTASLAGAVWLCPSREGDLHKPPRALTKVAWPPRQQHDIAEVVRSGGGQPAPEKLAIPDYERDRHECPQMEVPLIF